MNRTFVTGLISLAFLALAACGSSEKKVEVGDVESDGSVVAKDINFDPLGSDSGNISGLSTVNFPYDSSTLGSAARSALTENAKWINANSGVTIQIEGHCDSRGSVEYNLALGERRAKSVKNFLVGQGVPANRLTIISYGKEKPIAQGDTESVYAQNRRANFVPLPN
ncbi:MAG: peptidoglycan-associated lipoprotein [Bdellovibrionaceae bacterium]|nr:peptidoglycan-associated lipoprotein [Pseudobdellovibrionaceae bacterium]|tara:strand:+ start:157 stop:657 length:501 start_codon:yes stop_codon:yes gene_type:complete